MTSTASSIRWSDLELTMRDFVDDFRDSMPVMIITKTGYSGYDEDVHQIGAGEIYWVYDIQRQSRLVGKQETENKFLSIPVDYPLKVQVFKNGKPGPTKSIKDVSRLLKTSADPIDIQFDSNQSVSFQVGADIENAAQFGTLCIEDTYEEKYLLAYTIHGGDIFSKTIGLPVYMDITVSVAEGLVNGDEVAFEHWTEEVRKTAGRFTSTPAKMCQEIILFNQAPPSGHYEYIKPTQIANRQKQSSLIDVKPVPGGKTGDQQKLNVYVTTPGRPTTQKTVKLPLPPFPRRTPPSLPGQVVSPSSPVTEKPMLAIGTKSLDGAPPPLPANRKSTTPKSSSPPITGEKNKSVDVMPVRRALSTPAPDPLSTQAHGQQPLPEPLSYEQLQPESAAACLFESIKLFEDIPADIDVSGLSVAQISKTLSLMKLGSHCSVFESRSVDGELLLELNENILVKDFGFSSFDAKKLIMFTKGWRPKKF